MREGDLVLFSGRSFGDRVVQVGTLSRYSHVGIYSSDCLLFESTSADLPPCQIMHRKVKGSQAQKFEARVARYNGKVWRLPLSKAIHERSLFRYLVAQMGRPYDFLGAARSGGVLWNRVMRLIHPQSLDALFCSELCAAALNHVGYFNTNNASAWSPGKLVRELRRRGLVTVPKRLK